MLPSADSRGRQHQKRRCKRVPRPLISRIITYLRAKELSGCLGAWLFRLLGHLNLKKMPIIISHGSPTYFDQSSCNVSDEKMNGCMLIAIQGKCPRIVSVTNARLCCWHRPHRHPSKLAGCVAFLGICCTGQEFRGIGDKPARGNADCVWAKPHCSHLPLQTPSRTMSALAAPSESSWEM